MSQRRALVTGAAGFIGSHLVDRLLADGWAVTGVDSFEDYYARSQKDANVASSLSRGEYRLIEADLLKIAERRTSGGSQLEDLLSESDVVFHLAAQPGVRASWGTEFATYVDNNVRATQLLLETVRPLGIERFVYASSSSVYGDSAVLPMREDAACSPFSPYGVTKLAAEHLCSLYHRNFGLPTVSLRFFTVFGPRQRPDMAFNRFIRAALAGEPVVLYDDGSQTRDFTYVADIVEGLVRAADAAPGGVHNLGGGSRVTVSHVLDVLGSILGKPVTVRREGRQQGDVRDTWASIDSASEVLGYRPRTSLEDGLRAEVEWLADVSNDRDPA